MADGCCSWWPAGCSLSGASRRRQPNGEPVSGTHRSVSGARQALGFLTPLGGAATPTPGRWRGFPRSVRGSGRCSACCGGRPPVRGPHWWRRPSWWWPTWHLPACCTSTASSTAADGLLPHLERERRLEVMREPTVGAFGLGAGAAALVLRWAALGVLAPSILLLVGVWAASRSAMVLTLGVVPYARSNGGGLATTFADGHRVAAVTIGLAGTLAGLGCVMADRPLAGGVALASGILIAVGRRAARAPADRWLHRRRPRRAGRSPRDHRVGGGGGEMVTRLPRRCSRVGAGPRARRAPSGGAPRRPLWADDDRARGALGGATIGVAAPSTPPPGSPSRWPSQRPPTPPWAPRRRSSQRPRCARRAAR